MTKPVRSLAYLAMAGMILTPPAPVWAQAAGAVYTVVVPSAQFGSQAFTGVVVGGIAAAKQFCSDIGDKSFRVDCLSERLEKVAKEIPKGSDYAEVAAILKDTSAKLGKLAKENKDPERRRATVARPKSKERTTRPLTPVNPANLTAVNQQAVAILEETETILLRSAESSQEKRNQYAKIADAVGSNKVLLRA